MWGVKAFLCLAAVILVSSTAAQDSAEARDNDYEEKPYKFGFSIENYLHREEEKAGLDGPAMKMGPNGKPLPPLQMNPEEPPPPGGVMGCGSCIIPTAAPPSTFVAKPQPPAPATPPDQSTQNYQDPYQDYQDPNHNYQDPNQYYQQNYHDPNQNYQDPNQNYQDPNQYYQQNYQDPNQNYQDPNQNYQDPNQNYQDPNQNYQDRNQNYQDPIQNYQDPNQNYQSVYPTFQPVLQSSQPVVPPVKTSLTTDDMLRLLYRFNYTIGFHGHHEEGDAAGNKQGGYFVNGRDGYGRKFTYIANEFGYQPRVTLESLTGDAVPRQETEKSPEFGLKGYEFRWFY